jgi:hypothetical protein
MRATTYLERVEASGAKNSLMSTSIASAMSKSTRRVGECLPARMFQNCACEIPVRSGMCVSTSLFRLAIARIASASR